MLPGCRDPPYASRHGKILPFKNLQTFLLLYHIDLKKATPKKLAPQRAAVYNRNMDMQATYIVTGCTGYVGNVLTKKLLAEGCRVRGLARSREKAARIFGDNAPALVFGDIADDAALDALFAGEGPFIVIHTIAKVTIGEGSRKELYDVTVEGTRAVVAHCIKTHAKLLHISSTEAPGGVFDEDVHYVPDPSRCDTDYARAKAEADKIVLDAAKEQRLDASVLLFASVLGPGDYSNSHMTQMMIEFIEGRLPASVKGGYNDFDIRDVADVLPAIIGRAQAGESYIFAHKPDEINDVLAVIAEMTGRRVPKTLPLWVAKLGAPFLMLAAKLRGKRPLYTSAALKSLEARADFPIGKSVRAFGFAPRPLEETVRDHVRFLLDEGMTHLKD